MVTEYMVLCELVKDSYPDTPLKAFIAKEIFLDFICENILPVETIMTIMILYIQITASLPEQTN